MNPLQFFFHALFLGVLAAITWVAFWTVLVPELWEIQVWAGHKGLTVPVFFLGFFAGLVLPLALKR